MLKTVSKTIKIKTPDKLKYFDINGPIINALKNAIPIATPTIAIDRVLLLSEVLSDNRLYWLQYHLINKKLESQSVPFDLQGYLRKYRGITYSPLSVVCHHEEKLSLIKYRNLRLG